MSSLFRCSFCLRSGFGGKRYKCLICRDFEICAVCYEARVVQLPHSPNHAMQCILNPAQAELYFGGETVSNPAQPQSYTCSYCSQMGFTHRTLTEHTTNMHCDDHLLVVCPICAASSGPERYERRNALFRHLTFSHMGHPQGTTTTANEASTNRQDLRRWPGLIEVAPRREARFGLPMVQSVIRRTPVVAYPDPRIARSSLSLLPQGLPCLPLDLPQPPSYVTAALAQRNRLLYLLQNAHNSTVELWNHWRQTQRSLRDCSIGALQQLPSPEDQVEPANLSERVPSLEVLEPSTSEPSEPISEPNFLLEDILLEDYRYGDSTVDTPERLLRRNFVRELVASTLLQSRTESSGSTDVLEESGCETTEDTHDDSSDQDETE